MDWTIYCYHNVEGLRGVLNAVAAIAGGGDYRASLAVVMIFGFFSAALAYAFAPQKMQGWQWLASVVLVYTVLYLPKATVQLVDVTADEPPAVVGNVPLGLALLAGATSQVGHVLTDLTETAFSTIPGSGPSNRPEELSYQRNGMMFGARMVKMSQDLSFRSSALRSDMTDFFSNCVDPEISNGSISVDAFKRSTNVWTFLDGKMNPARFTRLSEEPDELMTCDDAYAVLSDQIDAEIPALLSFIAYQTHPSMIVSEAAARIEPEITAAYATSMLVDASHSAGDIVAQNAVINSIRDGSMLSFVQSGDTTGFLMNQAQSTTYHQKNSAFISNAKIAEQALPVVRNVIEAVTYALFPFVVLLLFLSSGRETLTAFRNYAVILIWIQLWPPLYAVLNYMASIYASYDMAAAAVIDPASASRGVALATFGAINDNALSAQAIVGYLTFSIPMLAWAALKRMENFGTSIAGALTSVGSTGDANAASASIGNMNWGMMSRNQANVSPSRTHPGTTRVEDDAGVTTLTTAAGAKFHTQPKSSLWADTTGTYNVGQEQMKQLARTKQALSAQRDGYMSGLDAALTGIYRWNRGGQNHDTTSQGTSTDRSGDGTDQYARASQTLQSFSSQMGLGDSVNAGVGFGMALGLGNGARGGALALLPNLSGEAKGSQSIQDAVNKANQALDRVDVSSGRTFREIYAEKAARAFDTGKTEGSEVSKSSSISEALHRSYAVEASYQAAERQEESVRNSSAFSVTERVDLSSFDPSIADKVAHLRQGDYAGLQDAMAYGLERGSKEINWLGFLAAEQSSPHVAEPRLAGGKGGKGEDLTTDTDLEHRFKQTELKPHKYNTQDKKEVAQAKADHDAKVGAMIGKGVPDAKGMTKVQGSNTGLGGDGKVGKEWTHAAQPHGDAQTGAIVTNPNFGTGFKDPAKQLTEEKAAMQQQWTFKAHSVGKLPWVQRDSNGLATGIQIGQLEQLANLSSAVGTTGDILQSGMRQVETMNRTLEYHRQNPGVSMDQAREKIDQLESGAAAGHPEAAAALKQYDKMMGFDVFHTPGTTWQQVEQRERLEAIARGEDPGPLKGDPIDFFKRMGTKAWQSWGAAAFSNHAGEALKQEQASVEAQQKIWPNLAWPGGKKPEDGTAASPGSPSSSSSSASNAPAGQPSNTAPSAPPKP